MKKLLIYYSILLIFITQIFPSTTLWAMGNSLSDINQLYSDKGIIGEKKTRVGKKHYYDRKTGITLTSHTKNVTFVTPAIVGDVAHFNVLSAYIFDFICVDWKYWINEGWQSKEIISDRVSLVIRLLSPDSGIEIETKILDLVALSQLNISPTDEQRIILQSKAADDPFSGEERILAAQQAAKWIITNDLGGYKVMAKKPIEFKTETIGNKEFIKAEVYISDGIRNKMCGIWALNYWGYREKGDKRRMLVWTAKIISDPVEFQEILIHSRMIFETLEFPAINQTVYPDLREKELSVKNQ